MPRQTRLATAVADTARKHFGFQSLREGQADAIHAILQGRDTLVIQHTGAGKSAIYQIAGVIRDGVTVVISPLIALQKDQVDSINEQNAPAAVLVNSSRTPSQNRETLERVREGDFEYIFLAPEQLSKPETIEYLREASVSLFVVDEAHCVVEWGRDFRPDYMKIGPAIEELGRPPILALTATASPVLREEIVERLGMRDPAIFVNGFDRPNIFLRVDHFQSEADKLEGVVRRASWADKPGIVYVATRSSAEAIVKVLEESGISALFYHGGLNRKDREDFQNRFMDGEVDVMVATNAFGMGLDKADIRFVYHYDICAALEAYYQEIGRAGRDGEESEAILFYRNENVGAQKFRTGQGQLEVCELEQLAETVARQAGPVAVKGIAEALEWPERKVESAVQRLADSGVLELHAGGGVALKEDADLAAGPHAAVEAQLRDESARREKLEMMRKYANLKTCRRAMLLNYFGDSFDGPCGHCDNCEASALAPEQATTAGTRREVV